MTWREVVYRILDAFCRVLVGIDRLVEEVTEAIQRGVSRVTYRLWYPLAEVLAKIEVENILSRVLDEGVSEGDAEPKYASAGMIVEGLKERGFVTFCIDEYGIGWEEYLVHYDLKRLVVVGQKSKTGIDFWVYVSWRPLGPDVKREDLCPEDEWSMENDYEEDY